MDLEKYLEGLKNIHAGIAGDVWPDGQDLYCWNCGAHFHATTEQCADFLAHGWPQHCDKEMKFKPNPFFSIDN